MNTQDEQERFEERAAILEYCAHLPRAEAERQARDMGGRAATPLDAAAVSAQGNLPARAAAALNEAKRMLKP
jgi:hypothetical protein